MGTVNLRFGFKFFSKVIVGTILSAGILGELLVRVKDDSLRMALGKRIQENPSVSPEIKIGIRDELKSYVIKAGGGDPRWRDIQIVYLRGDSLSLERSERIRDAFSARQKQFPYQPEIIAIGREWFYYDRWAPESGDAEIRYNNSNAGYATKIKTMLDSVPELGKFRLNKTNIGTPPYTVLIILPDKMK